MHFPGALVWVQQGSKVVNLDVTVPSFTFNIRTLRHVKKLKILKLACLRKERQRQRPQQRLQSYVWGNCFIWCKSASMSIPRTNQTCFICSPNMGTEKNNIKIFFPHFSGKLQEPNARWSLLKTTQSRSLYSYLFVFDSVSHGNFWKID